MRSLGLVFRRVLLITIPAIGLAGCTTFQKAPVNSSELGAVVQPLPGTQGKTIEDQRRIDRTVAASCSSGILNSKQCDLQTTASRKRKKELANGN